MKKRILAASTAAILTGCVAVRQNDGGESNVRPYIVKDKVHEKYEVGKEKVKATDSVNCLLFFIRWGSKAKHIADMTDASGATLIGRAKNGAYAIACDAADCDALVGTKYKVTARNFFVPVFEESAFLKEPVDEGHVALHRAQHDPDDGSRLLRRALPRLRVGEVPLAQNLPVGARTALARRGVVQPVDHRIELHAGLVEEGEVLGEADVRRRAGGVEDHGPHVPVRGGRLGLVPGMRRRRIRPLEEDLVDFDEEILAEALAEFGKNPVLDRACPLKGLETEEVLIGYVSRDLPDEPAVAEVRPLLDDERSQRHAGGRGGTPASGLEERTVLGLDGGPVDHVGENDILVLRIELHPAGLVESVEGQLLLFCGLVHASCSTMCGDIGHPHRFCLHMV